MPRSWARMGPNAEHVQPAGVRRDHAADRGRVPGRQVDAEAQARGRRGPLEPLEGRRRRRPSPGRPTRRSARAGRRRRRLSTTDPDGGTPPPDQAGVAALGDQRHARSAAQGHHRRHLTGVGRAHDRDGIAPEPTGPVDRVALGELPGQDVGPAHDLRQLVEERRAGTRRLSRASRHPGARAAG